MHIKIALVGNKKEIASFIMDYMQLRTDILSIFTGNSTHEFVRVINGRFIGENGKALYQPKDIDAFICFSLSDEEKIKFQEETKDQNPPFITYGIGIMNPKDCLARIIKVDNELVSAVNKKGRLSFFLFGKYLGPLLSLDIPKDILPIITKMLVVLEFKDATLTSYAFFKSEITNKAQKAIEQPKNVEEDRPWCPIM